MPSPFKKSQAGVSAAEVPVVGGAAGGAADGSRKSALKNAGAEGPSKIQRVGIAPGSPFRPGSAGATGDDGFPGSAGDALMEVGSLDGAAAEELPNQDEFHVDASVVPELARKLFEEEKEPTFLIS